MSSRARARARAMVRARVGARARARVRVRVPPLVEWRVREEDGRACLGEHGVRVRGLGLRVRVEG